MNDNPFNIALQQKKPINDINLTSLIDVTLVVLIIFMLVAPIIDHGIGINLPKASKQKATEAEKITISISKNNKVYLDNAVIDIESLALRLSQIKTSTPKIAAVIRADQDLEYKHIVTILDTVKQSGIDNISLAVEGK